MTTPNVPLRLELAVEVPGTPEQVWQAIATANGISSWLLPTDLEERVGGTIVRHMGETSSSTGTVTALDAPRRFAYVEPEWAELTGHPGANVTPLATEFVVEAQSGSSCVVRVVSSAFGTGAEWERELFTMMEAMWVPLFEDLRLYLTNFPGQRVTSLSADAVVPGAGEEVWTAMRRALGADEVGQEVDARGLSARVERIGEVELLLRLGEPISGYLRFFAMDMGDGSTWTQLEGFLFSADAPAYVEREREGWKHWLRSLAVPATT